MTEIEIAAAVERVCEFLERCGDADIEAGIGYMLGNAPDERAAAFKAGIAAAIRDAT